MRVSLRGLYGLGDDTYEICTAYDSTGTVCTEKTSVDIPASTKDETYEICTAYDSTGKVCTEKTSFDVAGTSSTSSSKTSTSSSTLSSSTKQLLIVGGIAVAGLVLISTMKR